MLMSRASTLILLGALVILTPFSGLPVAIRSLLAVFFGACVLGVGFSLRTREVRHAQLLAETPAAPEPVTYPEPQGVSPI